MLKTRHTLACLLLAACSGSDGNESTDKIEVAGQEAPRAGRPIPAEVRGQEFVASVLGSFQFLDQSVTRADERAGDARVKAFARSLRASVATARAELEQAASGSRLMLEPVRGETHETDLAVLSSTRGAPFDLAFAEQQMEALTLLVGLVRAYSDGGDNPQLKAWAGKHQAVINDRLMDVQTLKAEVETPSLPADQR